MALREQQAKMQALAEFNKGGNLGGGNAPLDHQIIEIAALNEVGKIRNMASREERNDYKKNHFLPKYLPFAHQYFKKGENYPNQLLAYCVIYLLDTGEIEKALSLAARAIEQGQAMPEGFYRTMPEFVAGEVLEWSKQELATGASPEPYFSQTLQNILTKWQVHPLICSKWLKLAIKRLVGGKPSAVDDPDRLALAIATGQFAERLNYKVSVRTLLAQCEMRLNALKLQGLTPTETPTKSEGGNVEQAQFIGRLIHYLQSPPLSLQEIQQKRTQTSKETKGNV